MATHPLGPHYMSFDASGRRLAALSRFLPAENEARSSWTYTRAGARKYNHLFEGERSDKGSCGQLAGAGHFTQWEFRPAGPANGQILEPSAILPLPG
jgi:hypothetical protein